MIVRLRAPKLEPKPKRVHVVDTWRDSQGLLASEAIRQKIIHIRRSIENGTPLPSSYYRKGVELNVDALLESEGFMHLHLGQTNTAELLWLVQYPDHVVLLELSDHTHFTTRPVGTLLRSLHAAALGRKERELAHLPSSILPSAATMKRRSGPVPKAPKPKKP